MSSIVRVEDEFSFFLIIYFNWRLIALQFCGGFFILNAVYLVQVT